MEQCDDVGWWTPPRGVEHADMLTPSPIGHVPEIINNLPEPTAANRRRVGLGRPPPSITMLGVAKHLNVSACCSCSHRRLASKYSRVSQNDDAATKSHRKIEQEDYLFSLQIAAKQKELERQRRALRYGDEDDVADVDASRLQAEMASDILADLEIKGRSVVA
jgi:hypothetical protein